MTEPADETEELQEAEYTELERVETFHEYNFDVDAGHIGLFGEESFAFNEIIPIMTEPGVEYTMANRFIRNILMMADLHHRDDEKQGEPREKKKPIIIHMKTCGGCWMEGMAIYHAIRAATKKCPVTILNHTGARSMSSIIFQAATKRVMMPDSYFMIHHGSMGMDEQEEDTFNSNVDFWRQDYDARKRMMDIYVNATKSKGCMSSLSEKEIEEKLLKRMMEKRDVNFTEWNTVDHGFADLVWDDYDENRLVEYTPEDFARNDNFKPRYK